MKFQERVKDFWKGKVCACVCVCVCGGGRFADSISMKMKSFGLTAKDIKKTGAGVGSSANPLNLL